MKLEPPLPPGHANRKALAYATEIQRLRAQGYSHAAIRRTLLQAGLQVSLTTIKRETARAPQVPLVRSTPAIAKTTTSSPSPPALALPTPPSSPARAPNSAPSSSPSPSPPLTRESLRNDPRSSRDIADAFMKDYIANPLLNRSPR